MPGFLWRYLGIESSDNYGASCLLAHLLNKINKRQNVLLHRFFRGVSHFTRAFLEAWRLSKKDSSTYSYWTAGLVFYVWLVLQPTIVSGGAKALPIIWVWMAETLMVAYVAGTITTPLLHLIELLNLYSIIKWIPVRLFKRLVIHRNCIVGLFYKKRQWYWKPDYSATLYSS